MPKMFSEVITQALCEPKTQDQQINKFTKFWKLTQGEKVQFADGSAVIINMLEFLESPIPSVRLASKTWLATSTMHFRRILDPVLDLLLEDNTLAE